jgi:hypothetical protein
VENHTYDLRYFETGSALFVFIWSRNRWKSKAPSVGLGIGDAVPLPLGFGVPDLSGGEKDDDVDGESMDLAAVSRDGGRGRPKGIENVFARAANDGKEDEDLKEVADNAEAVESGDDASSGTGDEMWRSFNGSAGGGVDGSGGWPSEVSHASRAAFSS